MTRHLLLALALALVAGCKKGPRVPTEFRAFVPTRGLTTAVTRDREAQAAYGDPPGMLLFYDHVEGDALRGEFANKLGAADGYQVIIDCGDPEIGFEVSAVKAPRTAVIVQASILGADPTSYKVELAVSRYEEIGLPQDERCQWTAAAKALCDLRDDPRLCKLPS